MSEAKSDAAMMERKPAPQTGRDWPAPVPADLPLRPVIVICGERYSANLGDGAIADCLTFLMRKLRPGAIIASVDLGGRRRYTGFDGKVAEKAQASRLRRFHRLRPLLNFLHWHLAGKKKLLRNLEPLIRQARLVVIGGGQLLLDTDLRFPLRIATTLGLAERFRAPVAFVGCGVAGQFSPFGRYLLGRALRSPATRHVSLRDDEAAENYTRAFAAERVPPARRTVDPAVWAAEVYGFRQAADADTIGLGVMSPRLLRRRADRADAFATARVLAFWRELAANLRASGRRVVLFCNGSHSDFAFAKKVAAGSDLELLPRAFTPAQLAWQIAQMKVCIAHRLHANILAFALGVPSVGLVWDDKVRQFGRLSGRSDYYLEPEQQSAAQAAALAIQAEGSTVAPAAIERLRQEAYADLSDALRQAGSLA